MNRIQLFIGIWCSQLETGKTIRRSEMRSITLLKLNCGKMTSKELRRKNVEKVEEGTN